MIHRVSLPTEVFYGGSTSMACASNGELHAEEMHGFFAGDTRVLSTYRFTIGGYAWRMLRRFRNEPSHAQWDLQNPRVRVPGADIEEGKIHLRLERRVSGALRDDLTVTSFADQALAVRLALHLDADFADLFEVKDGRMPPRLNVARIPRNDGMSLLYERQGFRRGLHVHCEASSGAPMPVGAQWVFDVKLEPHQPWRCCIEAVPDVGGEFLEFVGDPHAETHSHHQVHEVHIQAPPLLAEPFERALIDLDRLTIRDGLVPPFLAGGAPWFMALFGRDTLVTSLMTGLLGSRPGRGALAALGETQARQADDFRDAQPGKIAHELRRGELAHFHRIPHTPYFGSHDAPTLYVLALWNAFRWTGDRELLEQHLPAAEAALEWCEKLGDEDGDGLLEYRTRSSKGYRNQGWKDAGDAIPHEDGKLAEPPLATIELQGYWYAAQRAMAELMEACGQAKKCERFERGARKLRALVEERFWLEDVECYALAIDAKKNVVRSIASNAGHLLWCGLPSFDRARLLAQRLLAHDMSSGYGIRTLSADHPRYNPLSYQLGSIWPHDNALLASGLLRYGLCEEAASIFKSILEAAAAFEESRLPELFCGFPREHGPPVPYEKANVPQAWAAAVPVLAVQSFLGLVPDAPHGRCFLSPWLPQWLPELELEGIPMGEGMLSIRLIGKEEETRIAHAAHSQ
ncbi:MAG TPA: glycogen debranching N-terminal domain-containing protein, partial [bacterium]|nr:glycogen debranching N-terminal domain-containing protein [bacterium]